MSLETIITITAAICEILTFLAGFGVVIYNQGVFKATVTERMNALDIRFERAHTQNTQEIHELKQSVVRIDATVSTLREDRVRLNKIEEDVKELRQMWAGHNQATTRV